MKSEMIELLRRRVTIIADHAWRDRDAAGHLEALKEVSLLISTHATTHRASLDARLNHYLANSSFEKALAHLEAADSADTRP